MLIDFIPPMPGTGLLERVLAACNEMKEIEDIYLHVQTINSDGINFYKKFGFGIKQEIKNYYKRIEHPDSYILEKSLINK